MKTKLGISVGLFGALLYLVAYFGGYVPAILLAGYVLLCEENDWLKKAAVKAVAVVVAISFVITVINLIPDLLSWLNSFLGIFGGYFNYGFVSNVIGFIVKTISVLKTVLFLLLGIKALNQGTITVPFVDKLIEKNM